MDLEEYVYYLMLAMTFMTAAVVYVYLRMVTAPYGRHTVKMEGPTISARAGWAIMESPAVIVILLLFWESERNTQLMPLIFLLIWQSHYLHRTLIYPLLIKGRKSRWYIHILSYGFTFNLINGYLNGRFLFHLGPEYGPEWLMDPRFIIGLGIFIAGFAINIHSDSVLRKLRRKGKARYRIPKRGLHKYVASPNYFGEIVEWSGWALLTWSPAGLAFAVFTFANLAPRARSHWLWYRKNFPNYPKERKILVPHLY